MKTKLLLFGLLLGMLLIACNTVNNFPLLGPTRTPSPSETPTATDTPVPTPTPPPTPTPLPAARIETGDHALLNGDWDQALTEFTTAFQNSNDPEIQAAAQLGIGRTNLMAGNYKDAASTLETLIQSHPGSVHLPQAYFFLAQAYSGLERYQDAAQTYQGYLELRPGVIDEYVLDLRGDALFAAGDYAGAIQAYQNAQQSPSQNDPVNLGMKIARAYALSGDHQTALSLYNDLYSLTKNDRTRALIDLREGQSYTALGQSDKAYASYQDAVNNYPTAYESYSALLALVDAKVPVDELNRGLVDYYAGQYGVAQAAFDRYLQKSPADPGTALYYYGLANRALGANEAAIAEWDKLIQDFPDNRFWANAWDQKSTTQWAYLDQYDEAIKTLLDFVASSPNHPRAGEFLFDAAQVSERAGNLPQAADLWLRVNRDYPNYEQANRALFLAGITRYRLGDYSGADTIFQECLSASANLGDRAQAILWSGKAKNAQGDQAGAHTAWEQAVSTDPTGYYSERAIDLLLNRPPFTPSVDFDLGIDQASERIKADAWMRTTFGLPEGTDLSGPGDLANDPRLQRGTELWQLGMYSEAWTEFEDIRNSIQSDPVLSYRLANSLAELGLYRQATLAARQVLNLAGMDDASTLTAPALFSHLRFGTYFKDLIFPIAQEYGFHPLFLFSVVRQESLFESFVQSSAAANGLMQIIPSTGMSIAKKLGWPPDYTDNDLMRPVVNLKLGTDYLADQRDAFDGDMFAALAAYNGGPGNAIEWKKLAPDDPDLFLEVIRYSETRDYIRSIYETFSIYRKLYDRSP
jgi:soluble lytic murein transglycosylase